MRSKSSERVAFPISCKMARRRSSDCCFRLGRLGLGLEWCTWANNASKLCIAAERIPLPPEERAEKVGFASEFSREICTVSRTMSSSRQGGFSLCYGTNEGVSHRIHGLFVASFPFPILPILQYLCIRLEKRSLPDRNYLFSDPVDMFVSEGMLVRNVRAMAILEHPTRAEGTERHGSLSDKHQGNVKTV